MKRVAFLLCFVAIFAAANAAEDARVSLIQDTLGNYRLVYYTKDSRREEEGFAGQKVIGKYGFLDKQGVQHEIKFVASKDGYVPQGDLPVSVEDTVPVAETRAYHHGILDKQDATLPKNNELRL